MKHSTRNRTSGRFVKKTIHFAAIVHYRTDMAEQTAQLRTHNRQLDRHQSAVAVPLQPQVPRHQHLKELGGSVVRKRAIPLVDFLGDRNLRDGVEARVENGMLQTSVFLEVDPTLPRSPRRLRTPCPSPDSRGCGNRVLAPWASSQVQQSETRLGDICSPYRPAANFCYCLGSKYARKRSMTALVR